METFPNHMMCYYTGCVVPGGGAFEVAAYTSLSSSEFLATVSGRAKYGVKVNKTNTERIVCILLRHMLKL